MCIIQTSYLALTDLCAGAGGIGFVHHSVRRPTWETNEHWSVRTFDTTKEDDVGPGHLALERNKKNRLQLWPWRPQPRQSLRFVMTSL